LLDAYTVRIVCNKQTPPDDVFTETWNVGGGAAVVVVVVVVGASVVVVVVGAAVVVVVVGAAVVVVVVGAAVVVVVVVVVVVEVVVVVVGNPLILKVIKLVQVPVEVIVICVAKPLTVKVFPANNSALVAVEGDTVPTFAVISKFGPNPLPIPLFSVTITVIFDSNTSDIIPFFYFMHNFHKKL
jgi:hypothetical protein